LPTGVTTDAMRRPATTGRSRRPLERSTAADAPSMCGSTAACAAVTLVHAATLVAVGQTIASTGLFFPSRVILRLLLSLCKLEEAFPRSGAHE